MNTCMIGLLEFGVVVEASLFLRAVTTYTHDCAAPPVREHSAQVSHVPVLATTSMFVCSWWRGWFGERAQLCLQVDPKHALGLGNFAMFKHKVRRHKGDATRLFHQVRVLHRRLGCLPASACPTASRYARRSALCDLKWPWVHSLTLTHL